jgi:hypothetical protein
MPGNEVIMFRQSIKVASSYLIYLPVLAFSGLFIWSESTRLYALLSALLSFTLYPMIYGSVVETINKSEKSPWFDLLARYFASYLGLTLMFIVPILLLSPLLSGLEYFEKSIGKVLIGTAVQCVGLYIWPLVFLKRRVFHSISAGFAFLIHNPRSCATIIPLVIITAIIKLLTTLSPIYIFHSTSLLLMYGIGYLQNMIIGYIGLIIFSMATMQLLEADSATRPPQVQET